MLKRIQLTLGKDSNPVKMEVFRCEDPEDIESFDLDNPDWSDTLSNEIRNFNKSVRLSGRCFYIFLRSIDRRLWSLDKMTVYFAASGRSRKYRDAVETTTGPDPVP